MRGEARQPASPPNCWRKSKGGHKHQEENTSTESIRNYERTNVQKSSKEPRNEAEDEQYLGSCTFAGLLSASWPTRVTVVQTRRHSSDPKCIVTRLASLRERLGHRRPRSPDPPHAYSDVSAGTLCKDESAVPAWDSAVIGIIGQAEDNTI